METQHLTSALLDSLAELIDEVGFMSEQQLNTIPFTGSWTAAQLSQHMIMSNGGFFGMLNGPVGDTTRDPEEFVAGIKEAFLDFNIKMESPGFVAPPQTNYVKEELIRALQAIRNGVEQSVPNMDLSKICLAFELPVYGFLSRTESLAFMLYHTRRHLRQLAEIRRRIIEPEYEYQ